MGPAGRRGGAGPESRSRQAGAQARQFQRQQAVDIRAGLLAHQLQLRVVAEGVETERQRALLREFGCDEMQGYLFSKPVPAAEIAGFALRAGDVAQVA